MRLLLFSDIHNDWKALERQMAIEADYYIAAGDQVTWARGIERCGEILAKRGDKVAEESESEPGSSGTD